MKSIVPAIARDAKFFDYEIFNETVLALVWSK